MNLHGIVSGSIATVNPFQAVTVQVQTGQYTTGPDGKRAPVYAPPVTVVGQVQDLSSRDLRHIESLNIQGSQVSIYLAGSVDIVVRFSGKGGDLLTLEDGTVWLTTTVFERWPDWIKVAVTLQNGA